MSCITSSPVGNARVSRCAEVPSARPPPSVPFSPSKTLPEYSSESLVPLPVPFHRPHFVTGENACYKEVTTGGCGAAVNRLFVVNCCRYTRPEGAVLRQLARVGRTPGHKARWWRWQTGTFRQVVSCSAGPEAKQLCKCGHESFENFAKTDAVLLLEIFHEFVRS